MATRILVVDDEASVRFVFRRALVDCEGDCEVLTASSAEEALETCERQPVDLVITDLRMPGLDGIQLTQALQALHAPTVVVWMTAYGCDDVQTAADRLGVSMCLEKPLELEDIRASVVAALGGANPSVIRDTLPQ